jgi:hypothetical protein
MLACSPPVPGKSVEGLTRTMLSAFTLERP